MSPSHHTLVISQGPFWKISIMCGSKIGQELFSSLDHFGAALVVRVLCHIADIKGYTECMN